MKRQYMCGGNYLFFSKLLVLIVMVYPVCPTKTCLHNTKYRAPLYPGNMKYRVNVDYNVKRGRKHINGVKHYEFGQNFTWMLNGKSI